MKAKTSAIVGVVVGSSLTAVLVMPAILEKERTIAEQQKEITRLESGRASNTVLSSRSRTAVKPALKPSTVRIDVRLRDEQDPSAKDRGSQWVEGIMQIEDRERKDLAIEAMRRAMDSRNAPEILASLQAYGQVGGVEFDRAPFRPIMEQLLEHENPVIRGAAVNSLATLPKDDGDVDRLIAMAGDPDPGVRQAVVGGLFWASDSDMTGAAGEAVQELLSNPDPPSRSWVDRLWGARLSPELEERIVALARSEETDQHQLAYYALYSCLSTQQNKGPASVDLLIDRLSDPDSYNVGGRAAWGLGFGVQKGVGSETRIADAALTIWQERKQPYLRTGLIRCLELYGGLPHAQALENLADAPAMGDETRASLLETAAGIRNRHGY